MLGKLTGWHFLVILVIILLLFGAPKLPGLARSLGQSMKIFKSEVTPESPPTGTDTVSSNPASPVAPSPSESTVNESRPVEPPPKM